MYIAVNRLAFWYRIDLGLILALPFVNYMTLACTLPLKGLSIKGDKTYKTLSTVSAHNTC